MIHMKQRQYKNYYICCCYIASETMTDILLYYAICYCSIALCYCFVSFAPCYCYWSTATNAAITARIYIYLPLLDENPSTWQHPKTEISPKNCIFSRKNPKKYLKIIKNCCYFVFFLLFLSFTSQKIWNGWHPYISINIFLGVVGFFIVWYCNIIIN